MIRLKVAICIAIAIVALPAGAQERVVIGTQRLTDNGALFLAAAQGYFKAEGIDLAMTAYESDQTVAETLAAGATDFGLAGFTPAAFNFAGKGLIKAVAGQVREKRYYEGTEIVASNIGFNKGLHKFEDIANRTIAISALGPVPRYQLEQIARIKRVDVTRITIKPMQTLDAVARAVGTNQVDAAIMPAPHARELLAANQAKLVGWYSELDEQQFGALFVSTKMIGTRRGVVEKFIRAYRRGTADYAEALLRKDRNSKRTSDTRSHEAATTIARYVYPDRGDGGAAAVEAAAYFIEPQAGLDVEDIERQIAWYKAQGLIDKSVNAREVVDPSFIK
ncbi:MAG TPA: ABC transporter substrate-binding protein [Pseudolabrys sp.]|jgi:NitT/TauT family transport system substrate-binding protein|nr:ABC transporter substrate-binding protein [Pseudolabrys sp.]